MTRAKFEEINSDLFKKTLRPVEQVLKDSNLQKDEIDEVNRFLYREVSIFIGIHPFMVSVDASLYFWRLSLAMLTESHSSLYK